MSSPICLDSSDALPRELSKRLENYRQIFKTEQCLESVLRRHEVRKIADDLETYLKQQRIRGYHCTKEPYPDYFKKHGLRTTNVWAHQAEFLKNFGDRFSAREIVTIQTAWTNYFEHEGQRKLRDGNVWVCLSRTLINDSGTKNFIRYFGGEAIFWPLMEMPSILAKLAKIGTPVIVEVDLPGGSLNSKYPMSHAVLSNFHVGIRPDAYTYESEACLTHTVPPLEIICVTALNQFQS